MYYRNALVLSLALFSTPALLAEPVLPEDTVPLALEQLVPEALQQFTTPGMAVVLIKEGKVIHQAGYGERDLAKGLPVTPDTYFRLASVSKAFTAASVAMLVDAGKLNWDDKVVQHLPTFRLKDPWVTAEFTLRDLLSQRSGLASGAGDSMIWPEPSGFSAEEVIHNLQYLSPYSSFRSDYAYSNVMYITAAEVVANVSGQPWHKFIEEQLFSKLGMQCYAGAVPDSALANVALPYAFSPERGFEPIMRNAINGEMLMSAAAGGIVCRAADMAKWLGFLLAQAQGQADAQAPFSQQQLRQMWQPHTWMPVGHLDRELDFTEFSAYGLGWRMADMHGVKVVHHTGTLSGFQAHLVLVPAQQLGLLVLNNGSNSGARQAVVQTVLKHFLAPQLQRNWVSYYAEQQQRRAALAPATEPVGTGEVLLALADYAGQYADTWFGLIDITQHDSSLRFSSAKMVNLQGRLTPFADHSFVVQWDDENVAAPALVHFNLNNLRQVTGFRLEPYHAEPGARHAYRDMYFQRQP